VGLALGMGRRWKEIMPGNTDDMGCRMQSLGELQMQLSRGMIAGN
jgi:hypothetical protein